METCQARWVCMAGLLLGLAGCGHYTLTFQVEDVINDGDKGASGAEQLDVDVVCLTKADAGEFRELAEGSWRSKDWFAARDQADPKLRKLHDRIFALRNGPPTPNDTLLGPPLVSGRVATQKQRTIHFQHPQPFANESAIVVLGRFHDGRGGLKNTPAVILRPPPAWNTKITIGVGPSSLALLSKE